MNNTKPTTRNEAATTFTGESNDWLKPQYIAAASSVVTGTIVMMGNGEVNAGGVVGCAAATAGAYLATKWLTEGLHMEEHVLGKAIGLVAGIDLGYALTAIGSGACSNNKAEGWV